MDKKCKACSVLTIPLFGLAVLFIGAINGLALLRAGYDLLALKVNK